MSQPGDTIRVVNTAPVVAVALVAGVPDEIDAELADAISECGVTFGNRVEVDLDRLAATHPGLAVEAAGYMRTYRRFASAAIDGRRTGGWLALQREVGVWRENAGSNGGRVDLGAQFRALSEIVEIAGAVNALLDASPDLRVVAEVAQVEQTSDGVTATFTLPSVGVEWPDALGGPGWPTEVSRTFVLRCRYAPSRERRARRLAELSVTVTELWPDPAEFTEAALG